MPLRLEPSQIHNLQQMEVVVAGPEDANQLVIIDGQFDCSLRAGGTANTWGTTKETISILVGPTFTRKQFVRANATASFSKTQLSYVGAPIPPVANWNILDVDADWDDESGQVELKIETQVDAFGAGSDAAINGFLFHVTILAAVPAA